METAEFARICRKVYLEKDMNLTDYYPDNILEVGSVDPGKVLPPKYLEVFLRFSETEEQEYGRLGFSDSFDFEGGNDEVEQIRYGKELLSTRLREKAGTGDSILSIGIGNGTLAKKYYMPGMRITGIDMHQGYLDSASAMLPYASTILADLNRSYPTMLRKFDAIDCSMTAHHLGDVPMLFRFVSRRMHNSGTFFFLDVVDKTLKEHRMTFSKTHRHPPFHGIEFYRRTGMIREELERCFRISYYERIGPGIAFFECTR